MFDFLTQAVSVLQQRWEACAGNMSEFLSSCHPNEKEWKRFVITSPDQKRIKDFTKCEKLLLIGPASSDTTAFLAGLKSSCLETSIDAMRSWYEVQAKEGSGKVIDDLSSAQFDAKLALAVASTAKAVHIKLPKAETRDDKTQIVVKTKKHIEKAKLGKARA